jgi:hypothetical protein
LPIAGKAFGVYIDDDDVIGYRAPGMELKQGVIYLEIEGRKQLRLEQVQERYNTGQSNPAEDNNIMFPALRDPPGREKWAS